MVSLVSPPKPEVKPEPAPPKPKPVVQKPTPPEPLPLITAPIEAPSPSPVIVPPPPPPPPPDPTPVVVAPPPPVVTAPIFAADYLDNPAPSYPTLSRRNGEQGRVILRVLVSPGGRADDVEIRTSSGHPQIGRASCRKRV